MTMIPFCPLMPAALPSAINISDQLAGNLIMVLYANEIISHASARDLKMGLVCWPSFSGFMCVLIIVSSAMPLANGALFLLLDSLSYL